MARDLRQEALELKGSVLLRDILAERRTDILAVWEASDSVERREAAFADIRGLEALRELIDATINGHLTGDGRDKG